MIPTALDSLRASSFERLNLRRNPFGELPREERAAIACADTAGPAAFLRGARQGERRALQLVADHGRGKSSLLMAVHAREFPDAPYTQLRLGSPVPEGGAPLQFVDSIENLSWLGRRKLYSRCQVLACTTHRDLGGELRRAGFGVVSLNIGIESVDDLSRIVEARISAAALQTKALSAVSLPDSTLLSGGSPLIPRPSRRRLEDLFEEYGDDVRSIEHALYRDFERARKDVSAEALAAEALAAEALAAEALAAEGLAPPPAPPAHV